MSQLAKKEKNVKNIDSKFQIIEVPSKGQGMKQYKKLTLLELIVVAFISVIFLVILWPVHGQIKKVNSRIFCQSNLKGLGSAMSEYVNDFDGQYPQLPGNGPWSKELGFSYDLTSPDFAGEQAHTPRTITASWYLLVRHSDMALNVFVCPESNQKDFDNKIPDDFNIYELWDFGADPYSYVSYSMHNPYGKYPANKNHPPNFAVAADMSPWFKDGNILEVNENKDLPPQIIDLKNTEIWNKGNSINHTESTTKLFFLKYTKKHKYGIGQNVLYIDGHVNFENTANCGINNDNIYTFWSTEANPSEQDIQGGSAPTDRSPKNDAKSEEDSFLVI